MFVIKNTTDRDVVLDDLRLVLGPNKEIDLDRVASRQQTETSPKLRLAVQQKRIKVIAKDIEALTGADSPKALPAENSAVQLREMEERLKSEFRNQMAAVLRQVASPQAQSPTPAPGINELMATISSLTEQLKNRPVGTIEAPKQVHADSSKDELSDDVSNRMHALAMRRLEQKVTGHVEHDTTKVKSDDLQKSIDALDGMF